MEPKYRTISTDILVIGSGASGLRAAIAAYDGGAREILVLGKCKKGDAHTVLATGGINAALGTMDPKDSWKIHAADTLMEGWQLADYKAVELLCRSAPEAVRELVGWGARFHREKNGKLTQRFFGAHTYRRTCFYGDQTGKEMMRVLIAQVAKREIKLMGDIFVVRLLKSKKGIRGALCIDLAKGKLIVISARAVIIAAGGYTKLYSRSSSRSYENHGDGAALALEAGVALVDMEMVQFHPTGMVFPKKAVGTLVTEAVRGEGGILLNSKGERFMKRYDPDRMELGPRDEVARAIFSEIKDGRGTAHGGVYLDITQMPISKIMDRLPKMYHQFKELVGIDISRQKMEVAPTAHYTMGGVDVTLNGETMIKGLFAVGESVGQIHGANRLGGNSLLETIVYGKIVGIRAAERVTSRAERNKLSAIEIEEAISHLDGFRGKTSASADAIRARMQETMWADVGIVRNAAQMTRALKRIRELKKEFARVRVSGGLKGNTELKVALETEKMFGLCDAVIQGALMRRESRGAHYRSDYPKPSGLWRVNIIAKSESGKVELSTRQIPKVSPELERVIKGLKTKASHKLLE
ncbi:MAG TPA: FAD-binding protein [Candidatus Baltobacteraceae bacterium]|nr:FAD-binding protein [Candidatus Baltobacteraceae bacterium]